MRVAEVLRRHGLDEAVLDRARVLARRHAGAVGDAEDMRIDRDRRFAEGDVEHDVGGLAPDARQLLQLLARSRHLAAVLGDQHP